MVSPATGSESGAEQQPTELSRDLGFSAVFTTATGTMIGAGIFILPGIAAEGAGPGAALSFLLAGFIAGLAALGVCELATAMPKAGGPYYFVSRAMGPMLGTVVGLGAWLALIFKGSFALVGLGQYVLHFSPVPVLATAVVAGILLLLVNLVGAKASGILQNIIVFALLAILALFVGRGLFAVDFAVLRPVIPFGWNSVLTTTGVVFISYLGIVKAAAVAEEVENPGRNLPLGILSSVALVTVLYVCTMVIVTGVLPLPQIISATAPLADAGGVFLGVAGGVLMGIAGILATLSTGNAAILTSSRYPFAMARDALMTPWISQINRRFQTPSRSILVTGGVMILLAVALDVEGLAKLGGVFGMLVFSLVNFSVLVLRWTAPDWYRPSFRVPLFPLIPMLGGVLALAPIIQLDRFSQGSALGFLVLGIAWYYWRLRIEKKGGPAIQPAYGLLDKLEEIRQVQALEEKRRVLKQEPAEVGVGATVLAEIARGKPNKHLLALAAALALKYKGEVEALTVTEVPYQSPLDSPIPPPPEQWVAKIRARTHSYGVSLRYHHVLARNRAHAILSFVRPETRAILLDWHEEFLPIRLRGSFVDRVLRESPTRVAVLKYRGHKRYDRILVATAGGPYASAEVEMGDALARLTGARLTLLMVLPATTSPGREEQARVYLQRLADLTESDPELRLRRGDDVVEEILNEGKEHDLIILGATREVLLRHVFSGHLVGRIADQIAERSRQSVLVVRDPGGPGRLPGRFRRWFAGGWKRLGGGDQPEEISERDKPIEVGTFPRGEDRRR